MGRILDRVNFRRAMRRWRRLARAAQTASLSELRDQRTEARQLRHHLDRLIHVADGRLALPAIGTNAFHRPPGTDWAWRPEAWRGPLGRPGLAAAESRASLGEGLTLFHDCATSELTLRQIRNLREEDLAPFGLRMDVFRFDGSFLSLVVDLPEAAVQGLTRDHLIRMTTIVEVEKPLEIFARLNVQHGPNTEQIVREISPDRSEAMVEFDLAYSKLNEKRVEHAWVDLIFEGPEMNQVVLRDLTFARLPRAAL
ncbi:DUF6478 family protein [Marinibacterium profundimaris]|uniref:Uncharacterized protein n=1 Tax=Marinibacterium profundimaris TaxID=1679460 RepID=A0A225NQ78_9RHOB|nr:DUF6478 family protein [Marinibacterium profundimaris]OWU76010.1 hypothetical protein ATO3_07510 [Marinibacterium profundimaris]